MLAHALPSRPPLARGGSVASSRRPLARTGAPPTAAPRSQRAAPAPAAPRPPAAADDWAAAASFDPADVDFRLFLDDLCTRFARSALAGDERALAPGSDWQADVAALGNGAVGAGALDAARFAFVLLELAGHRWADEVDSLPAGPFKDATVKLHGLLEDSGWRLVRPGEEEGGDGGVLVDDGSV
jgi:hypothetical protein